MATLSTRMSDETHTAFKTECTKQDVSMQDMVERLVQQFIERERKKPQKTLDNTMPFLPPLDVTWDRTRKTEYVRRHVMDLDGRIRPESHSLIQHMYEWSEILGNAGARIPEMHMNGISHALERSQPFGRPHAY